MLKRAHNIYDIDITYRLLVLQVFVTHPLDLPHSFTTFALERTKIMNCCEDEITR